MGPRQWELVRAFLPHSYVLEVSEIGKAKVSPLIFRGVWFTKKGCFNSYAREIFGTKHSTCRCSGQNLGQPCSVILSELLVTPSYSGWLGLMHLTAFLVDWSCSQQDG